MDLQLVKKGLLDYARKKKKWVLLLAALSFSSCVAYKVYNSPSLAQKRQRISKVLGALVSIAEVISDSAETIQVVSKDFKDFLQSESDHIPNSLKQISKLTMSSEFSESVVSLTQALTLGILRGYQLDSRINNDVSANGSPSFMDKVFDRLSSSTGTGFVSVVVGSFARNLVMGFYQGGQSGEGLHSSSNLNDDSANDHGSLEMDSISRWVDVVCKDNCKELVGDCIQLFVSTAVAVYLDKTMHINTYDEIFAGLTNPKHEKKVRDVLVTVCSGAVETLVKTSHQVLTSPDSNKSLSLGTPLLAIDQGNDATPLLSIDQKDDATGIGIPESEAFPSKLKDLKTFDENKDGDWIRKVSSTLAVPSNRRLVLDVTGRVTFETVRSFLEFLLEKLLNGLKRCLEVVHEAVVESSLGVARYVNAKSSVVATICFSLCLHILDGAWILVPA